MATYSIWVLEYAWAPAAPVGAIVFGDYDKPPRKLPYAYILLRGPGVVAMVDVGYNAAAYAGEMADRFGVRGWRAPSAVLAEADLRPEDVGHVFLTHAHFDHAGNTDAFPNAIFYLQERELSKWVWARALDAKFRWLMATDPSDIMRLADHVGRGPTRLRQRRPGGCASRRRPARGARHSHLGLAIRDDPQRRPPGKRGCVGHGGRSSLQLRQHRGTRSGVAAIHADRARPVQSEST